MAKLIRTFLRGRLPQKYRDSKKIDVIILMNITFFVNASRQGLIVCFRGKDFRAVSNLSMRSMVSHVGSCKDSRVSVFLQM